MKSSLVMKTQASDEISHVDNKLNARKLNKQSKTHYKQSKGADNQLDSKNEMYLNSFADGTPIPIN